MLDLSEVAGFLLKLDLSKNKLLFEIDNSSGFEADHIVGLDDLLPILLNKNIQYPKKIYRKYANLSAKPFEVHDTYFDLYLIPYGLLGIEFIKSHIYYSEYRKDKFDALVQCYSGDLVVIMQKNLEQEDSFSSVATNLEDIKIINLKPGEFIFVPSGYFYTFVNKGVDPVVFSRYSASRSAPIDYTSLKKEKGMAYFIISKNAKVEKVANPKYKISSSDVEFDWASLLSEQKASSTLAPLEFTTSDFLNLLNDILPLIK